MEMTIQLWLEDKHGVLMRVAGILTGKGCNIAALHVAPDPLQAGTARMTIVADVEERLRGRVVKEMNRLVNVFEAAEVDSAGKTAPDYVDARLRALRLEDEG